MEIGIDTAFFNVAIRWNGRTAHLVRGDEYVIDVHDVAALSTECREMPESAQVVLLLRLRSADGSVRALFIDNDPVQTNVREVAPHLERLDDVFEWLLPPGYLHRQGDIGVYAAAELPAPARAVSEDDYSAVFEAILDRRHALDPAAACAFFAGDARYFVSVHAPARLIHPEHHALALAPGLYELRGARGTCLPSFVGLRGGERPALGE